MRINRRKLLTMTGVLPFATALGSPAGVAAAPAGRVRPQDAQWPNAADWDRLKQRVGGRLINVESPLAGCMGDPGDAACQAAIKDLSNPYFIQDHPGATQSSGWVDAWTSAPSVYAVAAQDAGDVAAAVDFAREYNLRLVVKGGGHSYQGTSNAPDSLLIWTHAMNAIALHDAFVGEGCAATQSPQPAVSIGAGAIWLSAYDAVTSKAGRYVQGGGCTTVGVAGLVQGGGFGTFSKRYGMAVSSLLEAGIVTADGTIRIANACTNPDLFWALKGGGGGTFGVVTRVTLATHELPQWFGAAIFTVKAGSDAAFRRLIGEFVRFYKEALFNPHWGETVAFGRDNSLSISMVSQGLDTGEAGAAWKPFLDWLSASAHDFSLPAPRIIGSIPARSWWNADFLKAQLPGVIVTDERPGARPGNFWWAGNQNEVGAFWHGYQSAWLPDSLLDPDADRLADALFAASRQWRVSLHFNKGLAGAPAEAIAAAKDTATNPTVQRAFALAIIAAVSARTYPGVAGHQPDLEQAHQQADAVARAMDELRKVAPHSGSYVSESDFFEPDWQHSFWGDNYPRLLAVKAKYDPAGLFFVHHGVGSEDWSTDGFVRSDEHRP